VGHHVGIERVECQGQQSRPRPEQLATPLEHDQPGDHGQQDYRHPCPEKHPVGIVGFEEPEPEFPLARRLVAEARIVQLDYRIDPQQWHRREQLDQRRVLRVETNLPGL
jgi:hypothetical protein